MRVMPIALPFAADLSSHASRRRVMIGLLALLVLATVVPRAMVIHQRQVLCTDGVFFVERAQAWQTGDATAALDRLEWNLYPILLWAGHTAGWSWEATGALVGLLASAALVIPLFWVVSRSAGMRVATVACLLYAFHPEAIDWSGEVIRDPLFWFALVCGWASLEQAISSQRARWFLATGGCGALTVLLRFEGWILILVGLIVVGHGALQRKVPPREALQRAVLLLGPLPLILVLLNVCLIGFDAPWHWGRFDHLALANQWLTGPVDPASAAGVTFFTANVAEQPASWREQAWGFRHTLVRAVTWPYLLLTLVGFALQFSSRRLRPFGVPYSVAILFLASIWVYLCVQQDTTARYFVPVVLLLLPATASGLVGLCALAVQGVQSAAMSRTGMRWEWMTLGALTTACLVLCRAGLSDALDRDYASRLLRADLGTWIGTTFGPHHELLCSENLERLVGHYAQARHRSIPRQLAGPEVRDWVAEHPAELLVVWKRPPQEVQSRELLANHQALGYELVPEQKLPVRLREAAILIHRDGRELARRVRDDLARPDGLPR